MRILPAALLLTASCAQAARPFVTDDARVVDKGGCQVETFYKRRQKFHEHEFWFLPACNPWGAELTAGYSRVDGTTNRSRGTWGVGAEVLLMAPRLYGIVESYGMSSEKPTLHTGLRIWLLPNQMQVDTTVGLQQSSPERRFATVGLRILW